MERRAFLGSLTGPVVAVCAVCMGACSKSSSTSATPGAGGAGGAVNANFTIDLNSNLTTIGSSLVQSGVIVVRLAAGNTPGSFTAVQVACTHEGTSINFNQSANKFICPNHGSTFSTAGVVTLGPAASSLKAYNITVNGSAMTISG